MKISIINPAQLWIGNEITLLQHSQNYLHKVFCALQPCEGCSILLQIQQQQYHKCLWFNPEGTHYTLDTIRPFFNTITRSLHENEKFFFIFQNADYFSVASSNSLLKSIEEPPPGYHMIFLAQNLHNVPLTLRSRCSIVPITAPITPLKTYDLLAFFIEQNSDFEQFLVTLDQSFLDDRTTHQLLEQIIYYWTQEYKKNLVTVPVQKIQTIITIIQSSYEKLPMPGSAKIFWKNLFLQIQTL